MEKHSLPGAVRSGAHAFKASSPEGMEPPKDPRAEALLARDTQDVDQANKAKQELEDLSARGLLNRTCGEYWTKEQDVAHTMPSWKNG